MSFDLLNIKVQTTKSFLTPFINITIKTLEEIKNRDSFTFLYKKNPVSEQDKQQQQLTCSYIIINSLTPARKKQMCTNTGAAAQRDLFTGIFQLARG